MTRARSETIDPKSVQIVHTFNRCVRRAYLCGHDPVTGKNYDHRKDWSQNRLKHLASCFGIDVIAYCVMSNHTHQVLRSRPDVVAAWSDREVAIHWLRISPKFDKQGRPRRPKESRIKRIVKDPRRVAEYRERLSDISWWMRYYSQHIAVKCNREDGVKGHFWESRFGHSMLEDDASVLACMIYVDLNPIRAQMAATPEESDYTSAKDRYDDLRLKLIESEDKNLKLDLAQLGDEAHQWERLGGEHSGWLAPIEIDERTDPIGPDLQTTAENSSPQTGGDGQATINPGTETQSEPNSVCGSNLTDPNPSAVRSEIQSDEGRDAELDRVEEILYCHRCSRKGVLPISLGRYLVALDLVGRRSRSDKKGSIDNGLEPILNRLGIGVADYRNCYEAIEKRCRSYSLAPAVTLVNPISVAQQEANHVKSHQQLSPIPT